MNTIKKIFWRNGKFCYDQFGNNPISKIIPIGNSKVFKSKHPYYVSDLFEKEKNCEEEKIREFLEERKREKNYEVINAYSIGESLSMCDIQLLPVNFYRIE